MKEAKLSNEQAGVLLMVNARLVEAQKQVQAIDAAYKSQIELLAKAYAMDPEKVQIRQEGQELVIFEVEAPVEARDDQTDSRP